MNEIETIRRAKMYIDKMSNGINPLNEQKADQNDVIMNPQISRCLCYVSDILNKVIDNGGTAVRTVIKNGNDFYITDEQKQNLTPNPSSQPTKFITDEINRVTAENETKKLQTAWINSWLMEIGILEVNEKGKVSTEQGNLIGITSEQRISKTGTAYYANIFTQEAQTFVFDNIDSLLAHHYMEKRQNG